MDAHYRDTGSTFQQSDFAYEQCEFSRFLVLRYSDERSQWYLAEFHVDILFILYSLFKVKEYQHYDFSGLFRLSDFFWSWTFIGAYICSLIDMCSTHRLQKRVN